MREHAEDGGFSKTHDMPVLRNGDKVHVLALPGDDDTFVQVYPRDHEKYPEGDFRYMYARIKLHYPTLCPRYGTCMPEH